jgi:hypothetical protein
MSADRTSNQSLLRRIALTITVLGAVGSLVFMFHAGRSQKSIVLIALFTVWVLSPFIGVFIVNKISIRWPANVRVLYYWFMIILTILSLFAYSGKFIGHNTKAAFIFLVGPLASWLLIVIFFLIASKIAGRSKNTVST